MVKKTKFLWITGIFITLFILLCIIYKPLYYRVYTGDRIKGNILVIIDHQIYRLEKDNISLSDSGRITVNDNGTADITFSAGRYGNYKVGIYVLPAGNPITVNCFQHDWWNVQNFEITIEIDTSENIVVYDGSYRIISEDGDEIYSDINKTQSLTDSDLKVFSGL